MKTDVSALVSVRGPVLPGSGYLWKMNRWNNREEGRGAAISSEAIIVCNDKRQGFTYVCLTSKI
jgi:hypothetical protein